jgi:hypothetical protein
MRGSEEGSKFKVVSLLSILEKGSEEGGIGLHYLIT